MKYQEKAVVNKDGEKVTWKHPWRKIKKNLVRLR